MPSGSKQSPGKLARSIAAVLKEEAERKGLSQTALGELAGMSQSRVSVFIRGKRTLDVDQLQDLCDALGLPFGDAIRRAEQRITEGTND